MKRRISISSGVALLLVMVLAGTTAAVTVGRITFHDGYCSGQNTINGTFTATKLRGVHGTIMTLAVSVQGYHNGAWRIEGSGFGPWLKEFNTSAKVTGRHRLVGWIDIWDGYYVIASAKVRTDDCA